MMINTDNVLLYIYLSLSPIREAQPYGEGGGVCCFFLWFLFFPFLVSAFDDFL